MRTLLGRWRRRALAAAAAVRDSRRHRAIRRGTPARGRVAIFYGHETVPAPGDLAHGGMVKLQELARVLPNEPEAFNVLYLGSSTFPRDGTELVELSRDRGAVLVWNQNGVAYRGWHGPGWEQVNAPRAAAFHAADHVLFQSEFCRLSADRFYGERRGPSEVLYNPVDTSRFMPTGRPPDQPTLLLGGTQYQRYRVETAVQTLATLPTQWRLLVAGRLTWDGDDAARRETDALIAELGLGERVELIGPYTQADAPAIYRRATLLLHTKYNDPCPTVVLEALASGLPVVYSASGGTPELVGEAGIGVTAELDWEQDHPPDPEQLGEAVLAAAARRDELAAAARGRAVECFDLQPWLARHRELFDAAVR